MFLLTELEMSCGSTTLNLDSMIPNLITTIVNIIKIGIPLLLIIFGMLDLGKAVMAQKEDEIKKGQQMFVKRLVAAVVVFLVVFVVQLVFNLVAGDDKDDIWSCVNCFINYSDTNENCGIRHE